MTGVFAYLFPSIPARPLPFPLLLPFPDCEPPPKMFSSLDRIGRQHRTCTKGHCLMLALGTVSPLSACMSCIQLNLAERNLRIAV